MQISTRAESCSLVQFGAVWCNLMQFLVQFTPFLRISAQVPVQLSVKSPAKIQMMCSCLSQSSKYATTSPEQQECIRCEESNIKEREAH